MTLVESDYALEWMSNPWVDLDAAGKWLLALAADFQPDLVHLNGYVHAALPWHRPTIVVAHSCVVSWWRAVHDCAPGAEWDEYRERVLAGLTAAGLVLAPSGAMARAIAAEYGLRSDEIRVIHNFSNTNQPDRLTKEPFFLAAGRIWDEAKNIALLEQIAPKLNWQMRVSGNGRGSIDSTASVKSARFLGMLSYSDLLEQMARASIFVHPALYEPFGLSVLEAARRGCCFGLGGYPQLARAVGRCGYFRQPKKSGGMDSPTKQLEWGHRKMPRICCARLFAKCAL